MRQGVYRGVPGVNQLHVEEVGSWRGEEVMIPVCMYPGVVEGTQVGRVNPETLTVRFENTETEYPKMKMETGEGEKKDVYRGDGSLLTGEDLSLYLPLLKEVKESGGTQTIRVGKKIPTKGDFLIQAEDGSLFKNRKGTLSGFRMESRGEGKSALVPENKEHVLGFDVRKVSAVQMSVCSSSALAGIAIRRSGLSSSYLRNLIGNQICISSGNYVSLPTSIANLSPTLPMKKEEKEGEEDSLEKLLVSCMDGGYTDNNCVCHLVREMEERREGTEEIETIFVLTHAEKEVEKVMRGYREGARQVNYPVGNLQTRTEGIFDEYSLEENREEVFFRFRATLKRTKKDVKIVFLNIPSREVEYTATGDMNDTHLAQGEALKRFLKKEDVEETLRSVFGEEGKNIAICLPGGGFRAMVNAMAFLDHLKEKVVTLKAWKSPFLICGVSGGTWGINAFFNKEMYKTNLYIGEMTTREVLEKVKGAYDKEWKEVETKKSKLGSTLKGILSGKLSSIMGRYYLLFQLSRPLLTMALNSSWHYRMLWILSYMNMEWDTFVRRIVFLEKDMKFTKEKLKKLVGNENCKIMFGGAIPGGMDARSRRDVSGSGSKRYLVMKSVSDFLGKANLLSLSLSKKEEGVCQTVSPSDLMKAGSLISEEEKEAIGSYELETSLQEEEESKKEEDASSPSISFVKEASLPSISSMIPPCGHCLLEGRNAILFSGASIASGMRESDENAFLQTEIHSSSLLLRDRDGRLKVASFVETGKKRKVSEILEEQEMCMSSSLSSRDELSILREKDIFSSSISNEIVMEANDISSRTGFLSSSSPSSSICSILSGSVERRILKRNEEEEVSYSCFETGSVVAVRALEGKTLSILNAETILLLSTNGAISCQNLTQKMVSGLESLKDKVCIKIENGTPTQMHVFQKWLPFHRRVLFEVLRMRDTCSLLLEEKEEVGEYSFSGDGSDELTWVEQGEMIGLGKEGRILIPVAAKEGEEHYNGVDPLETKGRVRFVEEEDEKEEDVSVQMFEDQTDLKKKGMSARKLENSPPEFEIIDAQGNDCATIQVEGKTLCLNYLKYRGSQKQCSLSGTKILDWFSSCLGKQVFGNVITLLTLDDASKFNYFEGHPLPLTLFRKIMKGEGWYESKGFHPILESEYNSYQTSFMEFRNWSLEKMMTYVYLWWLDMKYKDMIRVPSQDNRSTRFDSLSFFLDLFGVPPVEFEKNKSIVGNSGFEKMKDEKRCVCLSSALFPKPFKEAIEKNDVDSAFLETKVSFDEREAFREVAVREYFVHVDRLFSMFVGYELLVELPYTLVKPTTTYEPKLKLEEDCVEVSTCESPRENEIRIEIEERAEKAKRRVMNREQGLFGTNCGNVEKNTFQVEVCKRMDEIKSLLKLNSLVLKTGDAPLSESRGWDHFETHWRTMEDAWMSEKFCILVRLMAMCKYIKEKKEKSQPSFSIGHVFLFDGLTLFDLKENSINFQSRDTFLDASSDLLKYWSFLSPDDLEEAYRICFKEEIDFLEVEDGEGTNTKEHTGERGGEYKGSKRAREDEESVKGTKKEKTYPLYYDLLFDIQSGPEGRVLREFNVRKEKIALKEARTVDLSMKDLVLSKNKIGDTPYSISLEKGGMDHCRTAKLFQKFLDTVKVCRGGRTKHLNLFDSEFEERDAFGWAGYSTVLTFEMAKFEMDDIKSFKYMYLSLPESRNVVKRHVRRRTRKVGGRLRLEFSSERSDVLLVFIYKGFDIYLR